MKWSNALIPVLARPYSQPFPFDMKFIHIATLLMSMLLSTLSLNINRPKWGLSFDHLDGSPDILEDIPPLRQNSFLEGGGNRKYRQMSIDNNIEILKAKLINSLLVRRQNQATNNIQYIIVSFFKIFFSFVLCLMFKFWDRFIFLRYSFYLKNQIYGDFLSAYYQCSMKKSKSFFHFPSACRDDFELICEG